MSLRVGAMSATIATLLGTLTAVALSRGEGFCGRTLFSGMLYAPLVMPEVITGLSLLLLFVALDAERIAVREALGYRAPHFPLADHYASEGDEWMYGRGAHGKLTDAAGVIRRTAQTREPRRYIAGVAPTVRTVDVQELPFELKLQIAPLPKILPT